MISVQKSKTYSYLIEAVKWGLVIWLVLPIKDSLSGPVAFSRIALGVILFVIFSGKLVYDVVFFPRQHQRESSPGRDVLSMIGIVVGIALLVCLLVLAVALYIQNYMNSSANLP